MPYDSNGNYVLPAIYQAKAGTVIMTEQHNTPFEDVQAALNKVFLRDGSAPLLANMKMANFRITGLGSGVNANDAVTVSQLKSLLAGTALTGATTIEKLTISKSSIVPAVTDWATYQSVPAADADTRFLQKTSTDYVRANGLLNSQTGITFYLGWPTSVTAETTGWRPLLQVNGDYIGPLALYGDISSLAQTVGKKVDGTSTGRNLPVLNLQLVNAPSADTPTAYVQLATSWGALILPTSGRVSQMLVDYAQPKGNYQAAGDYALEADLPLDRSKKLQCFQVVIQSGQRVNFPSGFSASPDSINLTATQRLDLWYTNQDAGGFTINSNSSAAQTISVNASGNR